MESVTQLCIFLISHYIPENSPLILKNAISKCRNSSSKPPFAQKCSQKTQFLLVPPCFWEVPMILSRACFPGPAKELQTSLPHLPAPTNYASIPSQRSSADIGCPCGIILLRHQPSSATQLQCFRVPGSRCPFRFWVWQANDAPLPDPEMETQQVLLLKIKQLVSNSTLSITQWLFGGFCYNPSISTPSFSEIPEWYVKWLQPGYQLPIRHCLGAIGQFRQFLVLASWELKEPWAVSSMPTTLTKNIWKMEKVKFPDWLKELKPETHRCWCSMF